MAPVFEDDKSLIDFIKDHGVKGLVDAGISEVPTRFIHPMSERATELSESMPKLPPPIDLSKLDGPDHDKVVEAIVKAAETVGFFQVVNHGVPSQVLDLVIAAAHLFFDQTPETKAVYLPGVSPSPLVYYTSSIAPDKDEVMDWRDVLTMGYDAEVLQQWRDSCKNSETNMALVFEDNDSLRNFILGEGHGVKGLADSKISEIPTIFIQPLEERAIQAPSSIPKHSAPIDLSRMDGPDHDQMVEAIVKAAETVGFMQFVNHGVPPELLDSVLASANRFFDQPTEAKAVYRQGVSPSPLVYYSSSFARDKETAMEWRDFVSMGYTNDAEALQLWPDICKNDALEFLKSSSEIVRRIFEVLVENLKLSHDSTKLESLIGTKRMNFNFYPACPNPKLTIGAQRHSDVNTLTLLLQDGIGGLQVKLKKESECQEKEEWMEIPPIPGAIIINVGETLQIFSNGHYRSAEHRVKSNKLSRVSIPLFISPLPAENIGPLPQLVERDGEARYRDIMYKDYRHLYFTRPEAGKKSLDFVKKIGPPEIDVISFM